VAGGRAFDEPAVYEVRVKGTVDAAAASYWFEGLTVTALPDGETTLTGPVADQAALLGLLARVRDLGLPLLSVTRTGHDKMPAEGREMELSLEGRDVARSAGKGRILLRVALSVLLFSVFLKLDSFLQLGNVLAAWGWPLSLILSAVVLVRTVFAGTVVLAVLPLVLRANRLREWLPGALRVDLKGVLLGVLSFVVFCALAAAISLAMGIWVGDLSAVLARPDLRPDPDVIGWGYFLLALIPGIWEELAFRGLIQSKLRTRFSTTASILLSAAAFALFHFSNLVTLPAAQVIGGVIMATFFGIAWGVMTVRSRSVVPAMLSHYLVDSMGQIFLGVESSNPALATGFFMLLTLTFPVFNVLLAKVMYRDPALTG
jgi:membrane protease YdiL (CAAX protease family)